MISTASSDLDQSLVVVVGFLVLLGLGLVLMAYLEPGTQLKPLRLRQRIAALRARRPPRDREGER